jgi:hypothetical protein
LPIYWTDDEIRIIPARCVGIFLNDDQHTIEMGTVLVNLLRLVAILLAAASVGNWFLAEFKKAKALGKPWYSAYLTIPGLLVIAAVIGLPLLIWISRMQPH